MMSPVLLQWHVPQLCGLTAYESHLPGYCSARHGLGGALQRNNGFNFVSAVFPSFDHRILCFTEHLINLSWLGECWCHRLSSEEQELMGRGCSWRAAGTLTLWHQEMKLKGKCMQVTRHVERDSWRVMEMSRHFGVDYRKRGGGVISFGTYILRSSEWTFIP